MKIINKDFEIEIPFEEEPKVKILLKSKGMWITLTMEEFRSLHRSLAELFEDN